MDHPRKTEGIEIHAVGDECAVYETAADRIHYLNPTAALILEFCDGDHSPAEIAALVQEAYGLPGAPLAEVNGCLNSLKEIGIVR
ncbi:MAG: PqqD family protein [Terriglobales bacterium]